MAIDIDASYYKTGTATVAANGTTVTGQGTQWTSSVRAGDLFGTHVGDPVRILSVNSNTQLTLAYPWKGPAQTSSAYEIQFTPYDTGYYPAVRQLLQILTSGNVESFANISGIANTMAYFTGAGTMDRTGLTAFARTLLDDANASEALTTLGVSAFARTLLDDANASEALTTLGVSAFGKALIALTGTNGNIPVMTGTGTVASRPIVGPVSGADNALMEWGNNANGFYFRFANRLQICFNREFVLNQVASYQVYNTWTFPAAFNSYNVSFFGAPRSTGGRGAWASGSTLGTGDWGVLNFSIIASNFTNVDVGLNKITAAANLTGTQSMPVHVVAIGFY